MRNRVFVLGAINVDMVAMVEARPNGGQTVVALRHVRTSGGKGANQAVAAVRAGADAALIAAVGDDPVGGDQLTELENRGVGTEWVAVMPRVSTGVAMITVTPDGENSIVVIPGANDLLSVENVDRALAEVDEADVLVLQSEVSADLLEFAVGRAKRCRVVINNGPWVELSAATLRRADPLIVNEHEARDACGDEAGHPPHAIARRVREATGARSVLVTLGADGVAISGAGGEAHVPAVTVRRVVDTTGAGDTFVGTVAAHLAAGATLEGAAGAGVRSSGEAVGRVGARAAQE